MNFLRLSFFTALFTTFSVYAQDYTPIKIDLEGYVDDRKLEMLEKTVPVVVEPKKDDKKEEPKKDDSSRRRPVPTADTTKTNETPAVNKPIRKVPLNFKTKESNPMMMYMIIGGAVLLLIIVVVVVVMLKKKAKAKAAALSEDAYDPDVSLADKIDAHEQAVAAETTENQQAVVSTPPADNNYQSTAQNMADQFAKETAVDENGQNASGLIIDEDKYFAGGESFIDEDFSDFDGPHDGMASKQPGSPSLPPGA